MENDINFILNSIYNGKTNILNHKSKNLTKHTMLSKDPTNFHKITEHNIISTSGEQPLLIYKKKEPKISHSFDYKMTKKNSDKNIYISDGGLKNKNAKFNSGYNYININQNPYKKKSLRAYLESININKLLKTTGNNNKKQKKTYTIDSKKHIQTEEHIFYKTVRGSSNRPVFQKNYFNNGKKKKNIREDFGIKFNISNNNKNNKNLKNPEESKKSEENRNVLIDSLIKGVIKNNNFLIEYSENKINPKEILANKKKDYLQRNGIGVSDVNLNENEENEKKNEKNDIDKMSKTENNFNNAKFKNYIKLSHGISPKKKDLYMTLSNETYFLNNNYLKNRKPIVDQFEYIKKINKHKRLHTYEISQKERDKIFLKNFKNDTKNNQLLNDSFRQKNKIGDKNKNKMETKNKKSNSSEKNYLQKKNKKDYPSSLTDVNNDEYPYSHKRSYRTPKEINIFVKEKKLQTKKKVNNAELLKNKQLFIKFKNLYNLNYRRININMNKTIRNQEKYLPKEKINDKRNENTYSTGFSNTSKSIKIRNNDSRFRKRKEPNEYYVGNESFINNNSTLIDPNEYYLNVLESQQLLVNSELNKIENESDEETEEFSDDNEDNKDNQDSKEEINSSKEKIQKIIKKESKRSKNNNININNIKQNFNIQQIKTNTKNKNEKEKEVINPKNIIKLVEVLKILIQRRVFIILYKLYINEAIFQHYNIAFIYFIAICKNNTFRRIEEYSNYKAYNHTFRKLLFPFIRRGFKAFIHNCYIKRKIEILILLLNKIYKYKALSNIYIYSKIIEEQEEEKKFELVILTIIKTILKPYLKIFFDKLKKYQKEKFTPVKIKKEDIKNNIKVIQKNEINNNKLKEKEDEKNEEKYKKINKRYLEYSPTHNNKAKSYLYESFNDESSYSIRPNSLDNDKWHQIQTKIQLAKYILCNNQIDEEDIDNILEYNKYKNINYPQNNSFNSKKSEKTSNISNEKKKEIKEKKVTKNNNLKDNKGDKDIKIDNLKNENDKDNDKDKQTKIINNIEINNQNNIIKEEPNQNNNNINKEENKDKINIIQNKNNNNKDNIKNVEIEKKKDINNKNINNDKIKKNNIVNDNKDDNNKNKINDKNNENKDDINNNKFNNKNIIQKDKDINIEMDKEYIKNNIDINKKNKKVDEEINKKENKEKLKVEKDKEVDEKTNTNDIQNKPKTEEIQKNKKNNNEIINAPKKEKKIKSQDEIQEKDLKNKTKSDIDISAERDEDDNIDWEYSLNNNKNSLQNSSNSETFNNQKSKKENIDKSIKKENKPNNKIEKKEIPNEKKEEKNEKINKKINLIDDDDKDDKKSEESEKEEKELKSIEETKKKTLKKDKKALDQSDDDYLDEFEDIDLDLNSESERNSEKNIKNDKLNKEKEKENEIEKEKKFENNKDKIDKSRNNNLEKNIKNIQVNEIKKDNKSSSSEISKDIIIKIKNKEKFSNDLTDEILTKILDSEIKSNNIKLIPTKSFKFEFFTNLSNSQSNLSASLGSSGNNINKDLALLNLNQLSLNDDLSSLNDSIMSSYTAFSVFNRTIKDKKKEHSLQLYYKKIAPRLIKLIKEEIYIKYQRIYENISTPLKNQSVQLMMSLSLQDADMLRDNYKCVLMKESIKNIIDKEKILKKFEPINKLIRSKDNLASDNFYDNFLNECLIDTAIELINKERFYGENGDPLAWSSRTHELIFKYKKDDPKKLAKYVCNILLKTLHTRIGLLTENYDYLNAEQINNERDKRLIKNIRNELDEDEYQWRNLEMEETQLKVEVAELIMDQLYNENIEILEHIQYSRNRPDLYLYKSIYACEEIPKLSFQQTTTENAIKDKDDGDEVVNV